MKNKLLLLLFAVSISVFGFAQSQQTVTIKGILVDSLTNQGEPFATIKIVNKNAPKHAVKMAVTKGNGKFQENISSSGGDYIIYLSSIGRTTAVKEFACKAGDKMIDLGTLYNAEATNQLKGVEVIAQKPLVKVEVDKLQYSIEDDPDSKSNTVLEMLRKVPLVTIDGEDNIQVNGKSNFKVHVNGKPNTMMSNNPKDILKSMPASSIKYIEVITSPGAKYDAEGIGGILNIVTVGKGFEGYTATINADARNEGLGTGAFVTVKKGKLTLSGNYNLNYNNSPKSYSNSFREDYKSDTEKYLETDNSSKYKGQFQYSNVEASYEIDTLRLLSMSFGLYGGNHDGDSNGLTAMYNHDRSVTAYKYGAVNNGDNSWYSISGNLDYQRVSKRNKERMVTFSYRIDSNPQKNNSINRYDLNKWPDGTTKEDFVKRLSLFNYKADGETNTLEQTIQADFTTPIGKIHTIETGVKYILRNNTSDNRFYESKSNDDNFIYNENRSSKYEHLNHIISAYAGYTLRYKGYFVKPGVRFEYTRQNVKYRIGSGQDFDASFKDFVPSITLGKKIGQTQNLKLVYDMRISRPGIWYLNPYFNDQNPMAISQGNSNLKSEKTHSFNLDYSNFAGKINVDISLNHSFGNNGIERFSRLIGADEMIGDHKVPAGAIYTTYQNAGKDRQTGLNLYLNWNMTSVTRIYLNGSGSYRDVRSNAQDLHNYGFMGNSYCGIQQTLPLKIRLSLNGGGGTSQVSLQGKGSGYFFYSFRLNRSFLKEDRLTLSAFCSNVFEKYRSFNNTTIGENFFLRSSYKYPSRRFGVSVSYRLGELKASVKKAARSISNDDVKSGGSGNSGSGGGSAQ